MWQTFYRTYWFESEVSPSISVHTFRLEMNEVLAYLKTFHMPLILTNFEARKEAKGVFPKLSAFIL